MMTRLAGAGTGRDWRPRGSLSTGGPPEAPSQDQPDRQLPPIMPSRADFLTRQEPSPDYPGLTVSWFTF